MSTILHSTSLIAAAACALAVAGCSTSTRSDMDRNDSPTFCANGSSCQGPIWFNGNGEIINHPPGDASDYRRNDGASDQRRDRSQSWDNRDNRSDRENSDRNDGREAWTSANEDTRILSMLHAANQKNIDMGRLAQQRAGSGEARTLGDTLVRDHTDADAKVLSVARSANITLLQPNQVHAAMKHEQNAARGADANNRQDTHADLSTLQGSDFDRAFGQKMTESHRMCIDKLTSARANTNNAQVRDLLDSLLPTLRRHEDMASQLAAR